MKWIEIFKLYNLRQLKKDKLILILTVLSIFITTAISLVIPQILYQNNKFMDNKIRELNGGDLKIEKSYTSAAFDNELKNLKARGMKVNQYYASMTYFSADGNSILGSLVEGEQNLKQNEIILNSSLANRIKVNIGDKVKINNKVYTVKNIEAMPMGVDGQSEMMGYGKINGTEASAIHTYTSIILINGKNGDKLKAAFKKIEGGYTYSSLNDKRQSINDQLVSQTATLSILSTMSYILSILAVISSSVMIIIKRKKTVAVLRMLSLGLNNIKRALMFELILVIALPLLTAAAYSFEISKILLSINGIIVDRLDLYTIKMIIKGTLLNAAIFFVFLNISLFILNAIKPLSIVKEDAKEIKITAKRIVLCCCILIPFVFVAYSIYLGEISTLFSSFCILLFAVVFIAVIIFIIKILSLIPIRNSLYLYTVKNIRANVFPFVLILLSITLNVWFILIGFSLEQTIKTSFNKGLENKLSYNYIAAGNNAEQIDKTLKKSNVVQNYDKVNYSDAKAVNVNQKGIELFELSLSDYKLKFHIVSGKDVFESDINGAVVSEAYAKNNNLKLGNTLKVQVNNMNYLFIVKGIYDAGNVNQNAILIKNRGLGTKAMFLIKASNNNFGIGLKNSIILNVCVVGDAFKSLLDRFLSIFKALCFLCIFSSVLFNINMVYISYVGEEKDYTVIRAIGIGKGFLIKYQFIKIILLIVASSILSVGLFSLMVNLYINAMFKIKADISFGTLVLPLFLSVIITMLTFNLPIRNIIKEKEFNLLREQV